MRLEKETLLNDGKKLLAYWANNAGRGSDNCTLVVVDGNYTRPSMSRNITEYYAWERTSSWRGDVNLSRKIQQKLGIEGKF